MAAHRDAHPKTIYLSDYQVPDFLIDKTDLDVTLDPAETRVRSCLHMRRNPQSLNTSAPLVLDGQDMALQWVKIDNVVLDAADYQVEEEHLVVSKVPDVFVLEAEVLINPEANTSLEGLYKSRTMFCTQCEAEGFRKITYYLDRPDVLSEFTTRVEGDKALCPVLLSNGNLVDSGDLENGNHFAVWHDPFLKPAYLFALVGGDLECVEDAFTTCSGREVVLRIFVEEKDVPKCDHAMLSLKNSMKWDEDVYGREYDLDIYMIVAVDDFNMGAMENKGLNIFNTSCVLAHPSTTTDAGFQRVEAVVAHEYFHNWSGNRVTCRDWFQLSLKEGFTVFRDSQFSADMNSPTVQRVENVSFLRTAQFAEDAGPMAHPVRPASFIEISNFYTLTVYEKGAEVVRMLHTLLGPEAFRKGSDLYFDRHDGEAATIEDFVAAMEDASGRDLTQFTVWYRQAGTPRLTVSDKYDADQGLYTLTIAQNCPDTPEASAAEKSPYHIPIAMGLLGEAGNLVVALEGEVADADTTDNTHKVLELTETQQTFSFTGLPEKPVPVLLRDFSAPVKLHYDYTREQLHAIMSRDSDGFSRWDASQKLAVAVIHDAMEAYRKNDGSLSDGDYSVDPILIEAYRAILEDRSLDPAMVALMLQLPSEGYLSEIAGVIEVDAIHFAREYVKSNLAHALSDEFLSAYEACHADEAFSVDAAAIAKRSLRNTALTYLVKTGSDVMIQLAHQQWSSATNMTDELSALAAVHNSSASMASSLSVDMLERFYQKWNHESLVVNQWITTQATCPLPGGLDRVKSLMQHDAFDMKNPNKVRALIGAFCSANAVNFHVVDGSGYEFLADCIIELNKLNPQVASRQLVPLTKWKRYDTTRQALMKNALQRILAQDTLSKDVYEVVSKSLA